MQQILNGFSSMPEALASVGARRYMLVCGEHFLHSSFLERLSPVVVFSDFTPNPKYEEVENGVQIFRETECDAIVAIGGGSAMDVAKCIKLFCKMNRSGRFLEQKYEESGVGMVAVPTTAGTGSESTHFAVVYLDGVKHSVAHESLLPEVAILEPALIQTLPLYQKKCSFLDALCQGLESMWSVNSTEESLLLAEEAVCQLMKYYEAYLFHTSDEASASILRAANLAGQAINISRTTAPHAMSYKLGSMFGLPHGHAVAVCMPEVWRYVSASADRWTDPRGEQHRSRVLSLMNRSLGCADAAEAIGRFQSLMQELQIDRPCSSRVDADSDVLASAVNVERLSNTPARLDHQTLKTMYTNILKTAEQ